jgi:nitrogen fixation NifU-like protein
MSGLRDLYQEVILDHNKRPRNFRALEPCTHHADGYNPLCGDRVTVYVNVEEGIIKDVSFQGSGCAISTASASLMTDALKGKAIADVEDLFESFHDVVTGESEPSAKMGKLAVLAGVQEYPSRVKCATLAWHALKAALDRRAEPVKTE